MCQTGWIFVEPPNKTWLCDHEKSTYVISHRCNDTLATCNVLTGHVGPMTRSPLLRLQCSAAAAALREKCVSELRRSSKEVKPNDAASDPKGPCPMDQGDFGYFGPQMLPYMDPMAMWVSWVGKHQLRSKWLGIWVMRRRMTTWGAWHGLAVPFQKGLVQ